VWFYIDWYWGIRTKGRFLFFAQLQVFEDKEKEFSAPPEIATVRLGKFAAEKTKITRRWRRSIPDDAGGVY